MPLLKDLTKNDLKKLLHNLKIEYENFKKLNLNLNIARGKPNKEQLNLSNKMFSNLDLEKICESNDNFDIRNYGLLSGTENAKKFFAEILEINPEMIIVGGNSSLKLMFDYINMAFSFGILNNKPWHKLEKIKFLCPCPGYDRHFTICETFNIEMIPIEMDQNGPDMNKTKKLIESDQNVKGIWCVPKYSNPTGVTYSDETVKTFASLKPAAPDFRIFWDNAYVIHHLTQTPDKLLNIFDECKKFNNENMVVEFTSTSKISFPGSGISAIAASKQNIEDILKIMEKQMICSNKINQEIHCRFFSSKQKLADHMQQHAKIIKPKFDLVDKKLTNQLKPLGICSWTKPNGGYFISFETPKNCAKKTFDLCKKAGLTLTECAATFPYKNDENDSNIRIAPTFPTISELNTAMDLFCLCVKIAAIENLLEDKN